MKLSNTLGAAAMLALSVLSGCKIQEIPEKPESTNDVPMTECDKLETNFREVLEDIKNDYHCCYNLSSLIVLEGTRIKLKNTCPDTARYDTAVEGIKYMLRGIGCLPPIPQTSTPSKSDASVSPDLPAEQTPQPTVIQGFRKTGLQ